MAYVCSNEVWICTPDGIHNNYGIQIEHADFNVVVAFIEEVMFGDLFPQAEYGWFFQGGSNDYYNDSRNATWAYFEFWKELTGERQQTQLLIRAQILANRLGVPLNIK